MDSEDRDHFKTIASPLAPLLDGLRKPQSAGSLPSAPDPSYCLTRTKLLFSSYRKDEAHDPEIYCAAIAATLSDFPRQVVEYVTDPRTGVQSEIKWLPNIAEVRAACVAQAERLKLRSGPRIVFSRPDMQPAKRGDLFIAMDRPRYAEMSELLDKTPDAGRRERGGIWIPHHWYERREITGANEEARLAASRHYFERECRAAGVDPANGVSPSLLKTMEERDEF